MIKFRKKHLKAFVLLFSSIFILSLLPAIKTHAAGMSLSTGYLDIPVGGSATVLIYPDNAMGRVDVYAEGAAAVNQSSIWVEGSPAGVTVTGTYVGTGYVYVELSSVGASDGSGDIGGTLALEVNVYQPQEDSGAGTGGEDYDYSAPGEGSADTSLKKLEVEGYELKDEGNDIFSCSVGKDVKKVKIVAEVNDEKATVTGDGEKEIKDGTNEFEIIVQAENGDKRAYKIVILKGVEKTYTLKELKTEISKIKEESVKVKLEDKDVLDKELLDAIKKANKTIILEKYDGEKLLYSWTIIGKNINNMNSFDPTVTFESKDKAKTDKLINYLSGINLNFAYKGELPKGTKFTLNVSDKYKDKDVLYLYYIDVEKVEMTLEESEIKVKGGMAELEIKHCSEYFLTQSVPVIAKDSKSATYFIIMIAEGVVILGLIIFIIIFALKKKNKKTEKIDTPKKKDNEDIEIIEYGRTEE